MQLPADLRSAGVTTREAEVLEALGARLTNAEIADRLYISVRTVESHVSALLRKLAVSDRRALATRAHALTPTALPPLPMALANARATPIVGRTAELTQVLSVAEDARSHGFRRLIVVTGDAGIGKTRLASEIAGRLHTSGSVVLHGRCQDDALVPYQALGEAAAVLGTDVPDLLLPPEGQRHDEDPTARYRLFEEFDRCLAAQPGLVVVVLDDLQWIDRSGLQLLGHLLHHADRSSLLVLATARPEATEARHPVAAALAGSLSDRSVDVVELTGLSLAEAERLAESVSTFDAGTTKAMWERADGNPYLLVELLRHQSNPVELPTTVRDAIVGRIAGLGPTVFEALTAAAVMGEGFRIRPLLSALGGDPATQDAAIERAFGAALLIADEAPGEYRFAHAIVREALLGVLSPTRRAHLHLQLADALEPLGIAAVPEVARHRHAALPSGDARLAHRAADHAFTRAMDSLAYEVATSFADMALSAIDAGGGDDIDRCDATLRRGRAHIKAGDLERGVADCRAALELATRHDLDHLRADAVLGWAEAAPVWGRQPELRAAIEHVLAEGVADIGVRAQLKARLAQLLYYEDPDDRQVQLSRDAIDDAQHSQQPDILAAVLATTHAALWEPAQLAERTAVAQEIVAAARLAGHPDLEAQGLGWLAVDLLETGDSPGADEAFAQHRQLSQRLGQRLTDRDAELWSAMQAMLHGRFDAARSCIERARDLGETAHDPSTETVYWVQRYWLAVEQTDPSELDAVVEPCQRLAEHNTDVPAWRAAVAMLHIRRGDLRSAQPHYEELAADDFSGIPFDVVWLNAMTYLAETCAALGDTRRAPLLLDALEPYADRIALIDRGLACKGAVARHLGILAGTAGDTERAAQLLTSALERHEAMQAAPLAERTRRDLVAFRPRRAPRN